MQLKILYVGDIVGSPGRQIFARLVPVLRRKWKLHAVIANAENAAGGRGLTPPIADELFAAGADGLTLGDHAWDQREIIPRLSSERRIARPCNFAPECPGASWVALNIGSVRIVAVPVQGRVFMNPVDCPFRAVDQTLKKIGPAVVLVEIHAEATSEKIALAYHLDGRAAAVVGSHTHVQTADERVLPGGTAFLTDMGMTGARDSIIGFEVEPIVKKFMSGMPAKFEVAQTRTAVLQGALITVDSSTARATAIKRVNLVEDLASA